MKRRTLLAASILRGIHTGAAGNNPAQGGGTSAPSWASAPVIASATSGQAASVSIQGLVPGSPSPSLTYSWKIDGAQVGTSATYTASAPDVGKALTVTVSASNTAGTASSTSNAVTVASGAGLGGLPPDDTLRSMAVQRMPADTVTLSTQTGLYSELPFATTGGTWSAMVLDFSNLAHPARASVTESVSIVKAAVKRVSTGQVVPVTFGGLRTKTLTAGAKHQLADEIPPSAFGLTTFGPEAFLVITDARGAVGQAIPCARSANSAREYDPAGGTLPNVDAGTAFTGGAAKAGYVFGPVVVGRAASTRTPALFVAGDQIMAYHAQSWAMTALAADSIPCLEYSATGAHQGHLGGATAWRSYLAYCDGLVDSLGTNDPTAAQLNSFLGYWADAKSTYGHTTVAQYGGLPNNSCADGQFRGYGYLSSPPDWWLSHKRYFLEQVQAGNLDSCREFYSMREPYGYQGWLLNSSSVASYDATPNWSTVDGKIPSALFNGKMADEARPVLRGIAKRAAGTNTETVYSLGGLGGQFDQPSWYGTALFVDVTNSMSQYGDPNGVNAQGGSDPWNQPVPLDANGDPLAASNVRLFAFADQILGTYHGRFTSVGGSTISAIDGANTTFAVTSTVGDVVEFTATVTGPAPKLFVNFSGPIKNLRLLHPGYSLDDQNVPILLPHAEQHYKSLSCLRPMRATRAELSYDYTWADRVPANRADSGIQSWENVAKIANQLYSAAGTKFKSVWVNIPRGSDNTYVTNMATVFRDTLNPAIKIYVEFMNEIWNPAYGGGEFCANQAATEVAAGGELAGHWDQSRYGLAKAWSARRRYDTAKIWLSVFGQASAQTPGGRVRPVIMGQHVSPGGWAGEELKWLDAARPEDVRDVFWSVGGGSYVECAQSLQGAAATVEDIHQGYRAGPGGSIDQMAYNRMWACYAQYHGMHLMTYELGLDYKPFGNIPLVRDFSRSADAGKIVSFVERVMSDEGYGEICWHTAGWSTYSDTDHNSMWAVCEAPNEMSAKRTALLAHGNYKPLIQ
jgi:hypothetical protein